MEASSSHEPGVAVARQEGPLSVVDRARGRWDAGQVDLIRQTVAKDCTTAELGMFLELAARYELDPFAKQIWAARMGGSNGPVSIFAGRDGFLAIADRNFDYEGLAGDVVRKNDRFDKSVSNGVTEVDHRPQDAEGKGTVDEERRGPIIGAWALVYRNGRKPSYFYAPLGEYKPAQPHSRSPWSKQESAMILKCAEATALRKAYTITGLIGAEEVDAPAPGATAMQHLTSAPDGPDYGPDPVIAARLEQAFDALGYTPRKRILKLAGELGTGLDDKGMAFLLEELLVEVRDKNIELPDLPEPEIVDGEVAAA